MPTSVICFNVAIHDWWSKVLQVIAWAQIVFNVIGIIASFLLALVLLFGYTQLLGLSSTGVTDEGTGGSDLQEFGTLIALAAAIGIGTGAFNMIMSFCLLALIVFIVGAGFGTVLLIGTTQKRKAYLRTWIVYTTICWFLGLAFTMVFPSAWSITYILSFLALMITCIGIVIVVIAEIKPSQYRAQTGTGTGTGWQRILDNMTPTPSAFSASLGSHC